MSIHQAYLVWQGGESDESIEFSHGELTGVQVSRDPSPAAPDDLVCFYADITAEVANGPLGRVDYVVRSSSSSVLGATLVVVASDQRATLEEPIGNGGDGVETIRVLRLESATAPSRRVEVKAGCDFFFTDMASVRYGLESVEVERRAKVTLLVGGAQSVGALRLSQVTYLSSVSGPEVLGLDEMGLIANESCYWDTFGRHSGTMEPEPGCEMIDVSFPEDPDRRGEVMIPVDSGAAEFQLLSPSAQGNRRGVSATLSFAVLEVLVQPGANNDPFRH